MTWNDIAAAYMGVGLCIALLSWLRLHMMDLRDQVLGLAVLTVFWLPLILAGAVLFGLLMLNRRPPFGRFTQPDWTSRRYVKAKNHGRF